MGTLISLLATVVLISTVCTLIFAVFAYIASRRPKRKKAEKTEAPPTPSPMILPVQMMDPRYQASFNETMSLQPEPVIGVDRDLDLERTILPTAEEPVRQAAPMGAPDRQSDPGVPLYHAFNPEELSLN